MDTCHDPSAGIALLAHASGVLKDSTHHCDHEIQQTTNARPQHAVSRVSAVLVAPGAYECSASATICVACMDKRSQRLGLKPHEDLNSTRPHASSPSKTKPQHTLSVQRLPSVPHQLPPANKHTSQPAVGLNVTSPLFVQACLVCALRSTSLLLPRLASMLARHSVGKEIHGACCRRKVVSERAIPPPPPVDQHPLLDNHPIGSRLERGRRHLLLR
jgi:hypothetical protein